MVLGDVVASGLYGHTALAYHLPKRLEGPIDHILSIASTLVFQFSQFHINPLRCEVRLQTSDYNVRN